MKYSKRSQYKYAKSRYRVRNWAEYEAGLQKRGDLTVWLSDAALDVWHAPASDKPGGQRTYANIAIEAAPTIRMVFRLPLRLLGRSPRSFLAHPTVLKDFEHGLILPCRPDQTCARRGRTTSTTLG